MFKHLIKLFPMRSIGKNYMERYHILKIGPLEIRLHHFIAGDPEEHFHDHPFMAFCILVKGYYVEEIMTRTDWLDVAGNPRVNVSKRARIVKYFNVISKDTIHRIKYVYPGTWSLNIAWRTGVTWGFYDGDKYKIAPESNPFWYKNK